MRTKTTKRLLLIVGNDMVFESLHCENAIVTVNVFDLNIITFGKELETFFGLQSGLNCCLFMTTLCVQIIREMIDPHCH